MVSTLSFKASEASRGLRILVKEPGNKHKCRRQLRTGCLTNAARPPGGCPPRRNRAPQSGMRPPGSGTGGQRSTPDRSEGSPPLGSRRPKSSPTAALGDADANGSADPGSTPGTSKSVSGAGWKAAGAPWLHTLPNCVDSSRVWRQESTQLLGEQGGLVGGARRKQPRPLPALGVEEFVPLH